MSKFNLQKIQLMLKELNIEAWLLYDFRKSNDLAHEILDIPAAAHLTRRFFYLIPADGEPVKLVSAIEDFHLNHLPGKKKTFSSYVSLRQNLEEILKDFKTVAMEYSPYNNIPYVSKIDGGTIEFVRSCGVDIISSADLITMFGAQWTDGQYEENKNAAAALYEIVKLAFGLIKQSAFQEKIITEYDVQQFIMDEFHKRNMVTDSEPIVAVNDNAANPHYAPDKNTYRKIQKGDLVLIDLWAKMNTERAVMADITWVGFMGESVPEKYENVASIVFKARDNAFDLVKKRFAEGKEVRGYEVDDAARETIKSAGYGEYFIHRTGHSITTETHGSGANMDNYETKDLRLILPSTSFSIEPGIYLTGDFGIRSEIDVYVKPNGEVISTGTDRQQAVVPILK